MSPIKRGSHYPRRLPAVAAVAAFMTVLSPPTAAESSCKGQEKAACESKEQCSWVDGYTRKDGVKVSSHCRSAPKKKPANSPPPQSSS